MNMPRMLAKVSIEFNKMMIPVAIGGIAVAGPWTLLFIYLSQRVEAIAGDVVAAIFLMAFLMLTGPPLAIITVGVVGKVEQLVPWDT